MVIKKNILVCPLDWGLGHATRIVPVIELIEKKGANAVIAADNAPLEFLKQRFPNNKFIKLQGFSPHYPVNSNMALAMITTFPNMLRKAKSANAELQKIIDKHNINAVISDNRYELSTLKIPAIFITHQLNIQTPGWQKIGKPIINIISNYYLNKFTEIWVPDVDGDFKLSGKLSNSKKFIDKCFNIGLLSRFSSAKISDYPKNIALLIILSGPEPQRTILEKLLLSQALKLDKKTIILLAKPGEKIDKQIKKVRLLSHVPDDEFAKLIQSSKIIISRPGYSTLMDMAIFKKKVVFIPTPGQTEQEYLAGRLLNKRIAFSQHQNSFDLSLAIKSQNKYTGLHIENTPKLLEERMDNLLSNC